MNIQAMPVALRAATLYRLLAEDSEFLSATSRTRGAQVNALLKAEFVGIIDVEATCFESSTDPSPSDIIEIGWTVMNTQTLELTETTQIYVKPTASEVSLYCTKLTGITPGMLEDACSFEEALAKLKELTAPTSSRGALTTWAGFGAYDAKAIARQCLREGLNNWTASNLQYINLKDVVGFFLGASAKKSPGLAKAMAQTGVIWQGRHHCGVDDAVNTARLVATLLTYARSSPP